MKKITLRSLAIFFVLNVVCAGSVFAQQTITPEKKVLIREFLKLTTVAGFNLKTSLNSTNFLDSLLAMFENDSQLNDSQKVELRKIAFEANLRIENHVNNFNEDKKNTSELINEIGTELIDKAFTEDELKEITAFYRTPTGQKNAKFMATFVNNILNKTKELFQKRFNSFFQEKINEEVAQFKIKLSELKGK